MSDQSKMIIVFEGDATEVNFVHNILESSGITSFMKNTAMGQLFPHYANVGGIVPVKLFVHENNVEEARTIIENYTGSKPK